MAGAATGRACICGSGRCSGWPRQFWVMTENRWCSILFHLLVPGGKGRTVMARPVSSARRCRSHVQRRRRDPLLPPPSAVISSRWAAGLGVACPSVLLPPAPDALHGERRRGAVQAHVDPARVGREVVDAVGRRSSPLREHEVLHPYLLRFPVGSPLAPPVLDIPPSSFFLASTEITGSPASTYASAAALMCANCASRSGWSPPRAPCACPARCRAARATPPPPTGD